MAHRVHKTVAVLVAHAVHDLALFVVQALFHQHVQADLRCGDQLGGLEDDDEADAVQELLVGVVHLDVQHVRTGQDTDVGLLPYVGQHRRFPQERDIGHRPDALVQPFLHVLFDGVTAQHHQHLAVVQQTAVHGIEGVRDQVVIKRVVEQDALSAQQVQRGRQIVVVQLETAFGQRLVIGGKGRLRAVLGIPQLAEYVLVRHRVGDVGVEGGVLGVQLVAEQRAQVILDQRVVDGMLRPVVLPRHLVEVFVPGEPVEEEIQLSQQDHAEYGIEDSVDQLFFVQVPAGDEQPHGDGDGRVIERAQEASRLGELLLDAHDVLVLVVLIKDAPDAAALRGFRFDRPFQDGDDQPLQDQEHQYDDRIGDKEDPQVQIQPPQHPLYGVGKIADIPVQLFRHPAELRQPADPPRDLIQQRQQPVVDAVQQQHDGDIIRQRHRGHGELSVPHGLAQIDPSAADAQHKERQGGDDQLDDCDNLFSHIIPPC